MYSTYLLSVFLYVGEPVDWSCVSTIRSLPTYALQNSNSTGWHVEQRRYVHKGKNFLNPCASCCVCSIFLFVSRLLFIHFRTNKREVQYCYEGVLYSGTTTDNTITIRSSCCQETSSSGPVFDRTSRFCWIIQKGLRIAFEHRLFNVIGVTVTMWGAITKDFGEFVSVSIVVFCILHSVLHSVLFCIERRVLFSFD